MKRFFVRTAVLATMSIGLFFTFTSCDNTSEPTPTLLDEIRNYNQWTVIDAVVGQDPFLATAHGVQNNFTRIIYQSKAPDPNGIYPEGTIIVKELRDSTGAVVGPLTVMIKRGGNFNPNGNGWEWIMTTDSRDSIAAHGDNSAMPMCAQCHLQATNGQAGTDWVFKHPKEIIIQDVSEISDFTTWIKVAENFGPDPFLGSAHGVTDSLSRTVWMNAIAKPVNGKYPTGLIIVKELKDRNGNSVGPLTIMVKRGGTFNPDGNGWEWFMTTQDRTQFGTRGDNATAANGMCAGCHAQANSNNNGIDWVFTRP